MALEQLCSINFESNFDSFNDENDVTDVGNLENPTELSLPPTGAVILKFINPKENHSTSRKTIRLTVIEFNSTSFGETTDKTTKQQISINYPDQSYLSFASFF